MESWHLVNCWAIQSLPPRRSRKEVHEKLLVGSALLITKEELEERDREAERKIQTIQDEAR